MSGLPASGVLVPDGSVTSAVRVGAQLGCHLLHRLSKSVVQWAFIVFVLAVVVSMFFVIPSREAEIQLGVGPIIGLVVLGLVVGVLSGILGIGGGAVIVPMLILLFGSSDLVAKGTSLAVMIPTALSGTIGNALRRNVDIGAAVTIGVSASATTALGALLAAAIDPLLANILFAALLVFIAAQMAVRAIRENRPAV